MVGNPVLRIGQLDFPMYVDGTLASVGPGQELSHNARLAVIRGIIDNMIAVTRASDSRLPNAFELQEMARGMVTRFPCLNDQGASPEPWVSKRKF